MARTCIKDLSTPEQSHGHSLYQAANSSALGVWSQRIAAPHCSNFSAGVSYCKVFRGRSLSCRATTLSLAWLQVDIPEASGKVLAQEAVGVFIASPLPCIARQAIAGQSAEGATSAAAFAR